MKRKRISYAPMSDIEASRDDYLSNIYHKEEGRCVDHAPQGFAQKAAATPSTPQPGKTTRTSSTTPPDPHSALIKKAGRSSAAPAPHPSPRRYAPPWRRIWRGPLPPPRVTPETRLGDFILPVLKLAARKGHAGDPFSSGFQILNQHRPASSGKVGFDRVTSDRSAQLAAPGRTTHLDAFQDAPNRSSPSARYDNDWAGSISGPTKKLINPNLFVAAAPSYREVLMAGGEFGKRWSQAATHRGAPSDRGRDRGRGPHANS